MGSKNERTVKILLIDDDEDEYIIARELFKEISDHYIVCWVSTYNEGLSEIRKDKYDICLLDYHLGDKNGIEFIHEAVLYMVQIPIILITQMGGHDIDLAAMKAGAVDFLDKKSLNVNTLERSVRYALERKKQEDRIRYLAYYDQLTKLPNRILFLERLRNTLAAAKRNKRTFSIMFLDIDNFKRINDTLGHFIGDELIKEIAQRLLLCIRKTDPVNNERFENMLDTVARLGGDEFTILLSDIKKAENSLKIVERIQAVLQNPVILEGKELMVTVSIGIAMYPDDAQDVKTLLSIADLAMYEAKAAGKNGYRFYNASMNSIARKRFSLENDLRKAISNEQLELYYQPFYDLQTGGIAGFEALLRWNHPEKGLVLPGEIIPVAEETGMITEIDGWVLETIGAIYGKWHRTGTTPMLLSINISYMKFNSMDFLKTLEKMCNKYGIQPQKLMIEINEKYFTDNFDRILPIVKDLRSMGLMTALDNFGTRLSSLDHLMQVPFDFIKIHRAVISRIHESKTNGLIVSNIIQICHSLNLKMTAVGVENKAQRDLLYSSGCDTVQGYLFNAPIPEDGIKSLLGRDR